MARVGFVGTGAIAAPMARALARAGHTVSVSERSPTISSELAAAGLGIDVADNANVVAASEVVFLCLRPSVWRDIVSALEFRAEQQVVSVMAGVALADLAAACSPVQRISVTLPYGFVEHGGCPLPVAGDVAAVTDLFERMNPVLPQRDEAALAAHFAASTLVSAVLGTLESGADWLAERTGDRAAAEVYVARLLAGVLTHLENDCAGRLAEAKAALATPGTLNLQMVEGMAELWALDGLPDLLSKIEKSVL